MTGQPVGGWPANIANSSVAAGATITLTYTAAPDSSNVYVSWRILSGSGSLEGTASAPTLVSDGSTTILDGVAQITGGTAAYRQLKASNLNFVVVKAPDGSGTVKLYGMAAYYVHEPYEDAPRGHRHRRTLRQ